MNNNNFGLSMLSIVLFVLELLSYNASNVSGVWFNVKYGVRRQLVIILLHLFTVISVIEVRRYHNYIIYLLRVFIKKVYL